MATFLAVTVVSCLSLGPLTGTAAATPTVQSSPTITNNAWVGQTLTLTQGTYGNATVTDRWFQCTDSAGTSCGTGTTDMTNQYTVGSSDVGLYIKVEEVASDGVAPDTTTSSNVTFQVASSAPANSSSDPPRISGAAQQGQMLTASPGTWIPGATSYDYQWQDCDSGGQACTPIQGATGSTYTLTATDIGDTVVVSVIGVNAAGTGAAATSLATNIVQTAAAVSLTAAPGAAVTNQAVTLAATVTSRAAAGAPSGSVAFTNAGKPISGCSAVPVAPSGQSATVFCQTSFGAGSSQLTATFTPTAGSVVLGSSSSGKTLTVGEDTALTALDASAQVQVNARTTYTATVAPNAARSGPIQPTGDVEFLDGGRPIVGCSSQRLVSGGAMCTTKYGATGSHSIVAQYLGDSNFVGSSSLAKQVRITSLPVKGTITATMQWTFAFAPTYTRVLNMVINGVPTGASVQLACHGRGCPFAKRSTTIGKPKPCTGKAKRTHTCPVHGRISLKPTFQRRNLRPGAQITIEIRRPHYVGKYYSFTVLSRKQPRVKIGCLAVGGTRPNVGC